MIRNSLLFVSLLILNSAAQAATLEIPVQVEGSKTFVLAQVNEALKKAGHPELPTQISFSNPKADNSGAWSKLSSQVDAAAEALKQSFSLASSPAYSGSCFTGKTKDVLALIGSLIDGAYSDQFRSYAYKGNGASGNDADTAEADLLAMMSDEDVKSWKAIDKNASDITILYDESDDGDQVSFLTLTPCKK